MDREYAIELFNKTLASTATAQETADLVTYILSESMSDEHSALGCFEYEEVDNGPFADDEDEVLAQVAVQEDGPYAYIGSGSTKHRELRCQYPVSLESYLAVQQLKDKLAEIVEALDTVWTNQPIPEDQKEKDIPFTEEVSF